MKSVSKTKRVQLLRTGKDLFWRYGYKRVTVEEICQESGVSKMTFYKLFSNKLELASTIMDEVFDKSMQKVYRLRDSDDPPSQKLKKILQLKSEGLQGLSEELIKDLYANPDSGLKAYMDQKTALMLTEIISVFESGKQDGWIRPDMNVPFLFRFIMGIREILGDDEMLKLFPSAEDLFMEVTKLVVYGISPQE